MQLKISVLSMEISKLNLMDLNISSVKHQLPRLKKKSQKRKEITSNYKKYIKCKNKIRIWSSLKIKYQNFFNNVI